MTLIVADIAGIFTLFASLNWSHSHCTAYVIISPGFSLFTLSDRRLSPAEAEVSREVSDAPVIADDGESGPF